MRTCFACQHSMGADHLTATWLVNDGLRKGSLKPAQVVPVCLRHGVAFSEPCPDYTPVRPLENYPLDALDAA